MEKIKALCSDMRTRLDSSKGIHATETFELLELIIEHLEKPQTFNINIEKLVETINNNVSNLKQGMDDSKNIVVDELLNALKVVTKSDNPTLIKPQECRIGNYFYHNEKIRLVYKIEPTQINGFKLESFNPILINKKWLKDFGFKEHAMDRFEIILGIKGIIFFPIEGYVSISENNKEKIPYRHTYNNIKYVNEIQNIYFDLMQEELKIG